MPCISLSQHLLRFLWDISDPPTHLPVQNPHMHGSNVLLHDTVESLLHPTLISGWISATLPISSMLPQQYEDSEPHQDLRGSYRTSLWQHSSASRHSRNHSAQIRAEDKARAIALRCYCTRQGKN